MNDEHDREALADITRRIYAVISGPNDERDWESIRELYHPRATLVRTGVDDKGEPFVLAMSFDEYLADVAGKLAGIEFAETEISLEISVFGNVARLASVYAFTATSATGTKRGCGVNFFNLVNEGDGWKVMNIVWDNERDGLSLAAQGLRLPGA